MPAEIERAIDFPEQDLELDADADIDRELGWRGQRQQVIVRHGSPTA